MRRRHRHLNARDLGAKLVLDARYIDQSDNTAVSTWSDRSGNGWDATQGTGANQPTFEADEFGGSGVVRFGVGNTLNASGAAGLFNNAAGGTLLCVVKYQDSSGRVAILFSVAASSGTRARLEVPNGTAGYRAGGRRLDADSFSAVDSNTFTANRILIQTGVFDWANSDLFQFVDGAAAGSNTSFQTAGNTSATNSNTVSVGSAGASNFLNGDIGQALAFDAALTTSQRKRVEHAAAFSFKISCN